MNVAHLHRLMEREFILARIEALWRHSPSARSAMSGVLRRLGITDPRVIEARVRYELHLALYDLEALYPDAEQDARVRLASRIGVNIARGGGERSDASRFARDYLPELRDVVLTAWEHSREEASSTYDRGDINHL